MGTASVIDVDSWPVEMTVAGPRVSRRRTPQLRCECLEEIKVADIERGYHPCGRTIEVRLGPGEFGAAR